MTVRFAAQPITALVVALVAVGCARTPPPEPAIGFDTVAAAPFTASQADVLAVGGRLLDAPSVARLVSTMGEQATLAALGAAPGDNVRIEADGRLCIEGARGVRCRAVIADGDAYRLFDQAGSPKGSLTPSPG